MPKNRTILKAFSPVAALAATLIALLITGCANPGSGPDGGPYDETPPMIVGMSPEMGKTNENTKKITILFSELIKVENAAEKVTVSPPQTEQPDIRVSGRRVTVSLADSLKPNTTYTIDFSDAIEDANEGNPLGQFTYYFSTGNSIDTMEVAGYVLNAADLEPVKGILVGLHSDTADTAFSTKPFERVARTDGSGRFSIKGVAQGTYRIYALQDMDGDFKFAPGETAGVFSQLVKPSSFPDTRNDTIWRDSTHYDTIITRNFTHFMPDDVVIRAFTPIPSKRYFLKSERKEPESFTMYFTAPSAKTPTLRGLNFDGEKDLIVQKTPTNDTITYWLRHTDLPQIDTLKFTYTYEAYDDSLATNIERTDTLELTPRNTMAKRLKQKAEDMEKWQKQLEKRHKKGDFSQETPPAEMLKMNCNAPAKLAPDQNPVITFEEPLARVDTSGFHLRYMVNDSTGRDTTFLLLPDPNNMMRFTLMGEWRYGQHYEILIDSAAVTGLYGLKNGPVKKQFSIGKEADYGTLFLTLPGADSTATVQLMKDATKVVRQTRSKNSRADFFYLEPGEYYLRLFYDRNNNGKWDTGDFTRRIDPEEVFYFPVKLDIRANWDIDQTWNVNSLPLERQKPAELIKQKEDKKETPKGRNAERERNKRAS